MVMVDEATGNKYMRMIDHTGLGGDGDNSWLVKDMHQELKSWGHPGGARNALILKSDGEPAIVAVREALARCHGGRITPEQPPVGEHQANGAAEAAAREMKGQVRAIRCLLEPKLQQRFGEREPILQWARRHAASSVNRYRISKDGRTAEECRTEATPDNIWGDRILREGKAAEEE